MNDNSIAAEVPATINSDTIPAVLNRVAYRIHKVADPVSRVVNGIGIVVLMAMMLLIVADVFLRYFLKHPILGSLEFIEFMMLIVVFFAIAYTTAKKGHVGIDILISHLPITSRSILASINTLIGIAVFSLISWQSVIYAKAQWLRGITSAVWYIPSSPFILLLTFCTILMSVVLLGDFFEHLAQAIKKNNAMTYSFLLIGITIAALLVTSPMWLRVLPLELSPNTTGYLILALLLVFLFSGMPVGIVMALAGFMGIAYITGIDSALNALGRVPYSTAANYTLSVIPLFILMGFFVFYAGVSEELYFAANKWMGHLPGGLAMATIGACAAFSAACGSSPATAATVGVVALPEMKRYKYDAALATGCVAAGGTLGVLIPPSVAFCVIGLITEQSIGKLFMAGIIPGLILSALFMITIYVRARINVIVGPPAPKSSLRERLNSFKYTWGVLILFLLVMGGIYMGVFTPTEAAGIGAFGALLLGIARGKFTRQNFISSLLETGKITAMIFIIFVGAMIFGYFLTLSDLPSALVSVVKGMSVNRYIILLVIILVYLILGCLMDVVAMVLLTLPIVYPIIISLGFDPIWFGVVLVILAEVALITPPVGMNVYVIAGVVKDVPMSTIFRGIFPFVFPAFICITLLTLFPQLALYLPSLIK